MKDKGAISPSPEVGGDQDDLPTPAHAKTVAILLCTYNGARFLTDQLESFTRQTYPHWKLFVSDDGSTDETGSILERYQSTLGGDRVQIFKGPQRGFGSNFMSLIQNTGINADFYAFSDQDDIWFDDKLERSLAALSGTAEETPALYCSRTRLVDVDRRPLGHSPLFEKAPSFNNALVQSIAGANTMLINDTARNMLLTVSPNATIVAHDWMTYLIVTGCGGVAIYDAKPTMDYRQHAANLIGANSSFTQRLARLLKMCGGRFREWSDLNLLALEGTMSFLSPASRDTLDLFERARKSPLIKRLRLMYCAKVYRQTISGNISLVIATWLRKI
ncbi:glycosyltransferase family 2 protein [Pseudomonas sp. TE3610]